MKTDDLERRYVDALLANASERVQIDVSLSSLGTIVATLQLALRHPHFPLSLRAEVESFLAQTTDVVATRFPTVAEGWRRGNDPQWDVPRERRDRR